MYLKRIFHSFVVSDGNQTECAAIFTAITSAGIPKHHGRLCSQRLLGEVLEATTGVVAPRPL